MSNDESAEEKPPETQTEVEMDGPKKPPRKTAIGVREFNFKPGQNVICTIMRSYPGGYHVIVPQCNLPGYLPTDFRHNVGEEILLKYVCRDKVNDLLLFAERF